jgi:hypothetical protein
MPEHYTPRGVGGDMAGDSPLFRQWNLLRALGARRFGLTLKEMADEMGVRGQSLQGGA